MNLVVVEGILMAILTDQQTRTELVDSALQEVVPALSNAITIIK